MWALPKGLIDPGESPEATAVREVAEETGAGDGSSRSSATSSTSTRGTASASSRSSASTFSATGGRLGRIPPEHAHEVAEVRWLPLEEAPRLLAYKGEREMAERARAVLAGEAL